MLLAGYMFLTLGQNQASRFPYIPSLYAKLPLTNWLLFHVYICENISLLILYSNSCTEIEKTYFQKCRTIPSTYRITPIFSLSFFVFFFVFFFTYLAHTKLTYFKMLKLIK